ncbi:MAG TPA: hemolysin family protein [Acidimicrobiia bacterium]|nr:hemolysin family protein [Acidimicrobiia bacterium]
MRPPISDSVPLIVLLACLVVVAAILAAAETALLRVPRIRIEVLADEDDRGARRIRGLLGNLTRVLNTVLLAVLLAQVGAATVAGFLAERHFGNTAITIASVVLTLVMFVYTEAIPKTMAVHHPVRVARFVAIPVMVVDVVLRPLVAVLVKFADLQAPGRGIPSPAGVTEVELRRLAAEAEAAGEIDTADLDLIERAFRVGDERVSAILVPRPEIVAVRHGTLLREAMEIALASGHRRLPVYQRDLDDITGVVAMRDLAAAVTGDDDTGTVDDLVKPVLVVPESQRILGVLRAMQEAGRHLAAVVDEHGGIAGIVTIEDIAEELVGEIADEDRVATPLIRPTGPGRWIALGATPLREIEERFGVSFAVEDVHTVAGLVLTLTGRVPRAGETVEVDGLRFRVMSATRRRVRAVEIRRVRSTGEDGRDV